MHLYHNVSAYCLNYPTKIIVIIVIIMIIIIIIIIIIVEELIKKPVLFPWLEGATFHWIVVGYKFNLISDMN